MTAETTMPAADKKVVFLLLDTGLSFIGVESDLEAGMQLVDVLDATEGRSGLVLVNVAPRGGHTTKWEKWYTIWFFLLR